MRGRKLPGLTCTMKGWDVTNGGLPLSVTRTSTSWSPAPWVSLGVHLKTPADVTSRPLGPFTNAYENRYTDRFPSVETIEYSKDCPSVTARLGIVT